ncbi:hypothetical protein Pelo_19745 [Pelomyxa schiedti]|nr:hypothetical protein Pelo_19745 [Pelomyxa schiedti]
MVMETRRRFVIGFGGLVANEKGGGGDGADDGGDRHENEPTRHQSWIASFGVSPLVMGMTDGPTVVPDPLGADAASCSFHGVTRWVGETRRLMPNFMLHDLVTGQILGDRDRETGGPTAC